LYVFKFHGAIFFDAVILLTLSKVGLIHLYQLVGIRIKRLRGVLPGQVFFVGSFIPLPVRAVVGYTKFL
jgi:hypothetical protein